MSGNGAYEDEMSEVALFESALRAAVPTRPDPRLGAALVPRLAATARASTIEAETHAVAAGARRRPRSRLASVARVGIAVALIPLVLAGLAFAGVTVPGAARSAFDSVGITLPNQPASDKEGTTNTTPTKTTTEPSSSNPANPGAAERGKSEGAHKGKSAAAHQHALAQRQKARGKAIGHTRGKAIGLTGSTPPGHSGQTGPPPHSNAGGNSTHAAPTTPPPPPSPRGKSRQRTYPTSPGNGRGHSK